MGRPQSNTVEYYPHFAEQGKTLFILKSRFGNDGYAFWFQLLELLCRTENHYYDCNRPTDWQYLLSCTGVTEESGTEILRLLSDLEKIDPELWQGRIIWCKNLVTNISDVYKKRGRVIPTPPTPLRTNHAVSGTEKTEAAMPSAISGAETPQSKEKYSKVNDIYPQNSQEHQLVSLLKAKILENNPRARVPANLQKWCQQVHLLLSKNGYQPDEVQRVIEYCQTDSFWKTNILSAQKLRAKFDTLHLQVKEQEKGGRRGKSRHSRELPKVYTPTNPDYPDL